MRGEIAGDGRAHPARADALRRGVLHPRLRRDGGPRLAGPHESPAGASTTSAPTIPRRDDADWLHHLNLRKSAWRRDGVPARPVAPYLVPVAASTPTGGASRHLGEVHPEQVATAGPREVAPVGSGTVKTRTVLPPATAPSPRILELLALAEDQPGLRELRPYLADPDPAVRRTAVATLTETAPDGTGPALAAALGDPDAGVRRRRPVPCANWSRYSRPRTRCATP